MSVIGGLWLGVALAAPKAACEGDRVVLRDQGQTWALDAGAVCVGGTYRAHRTFARDGSPCWGVQHDWIEAAAGNRIQHRDATVYCAEGGALHLVVSRSLGRLHATAPADVLGPEVITAELRARGQELWVDDEPWPWRDPPAPVLVWGEAHIQLEHRWERYPLRVQETQGASLVGAWEPPDAPPWFVVRTETPVPTVRLYVLEEGRLEERGVRIVPRDARVTLDGPAILVDGQAWDGSSEAAHLERVGDRWAIRHLGARHLLTPDPTSGAIHLLGVVSPPAAWGRELGCFAVEGVQGASRQVSVWCPASDGLERTADLWLDRDAEVSVRHGAIEIRSARWQWVPPPGP